MAYIVGADRYQTRMVTTSLDDLISKDNSVRVIDSYVETLDLENLGFIEYSGRNRGQSPYRRSDLLKLHIYGYLNKIRSSRALETEAKRNLELMWLINCITPDHGIPVTENGILGIASVMWQVICQKSCNQTGKISRIRAH